MSYEPKNILLTGGCGFIGSKVLEYLTQKYPQYNFVNIDCLDDCATVNNVAAVQNMPNYHFVKGNILSSDLVNYVLRQNNIDTIMHFAAQSHVDNSFGNSFVFTETNVLGTHVLLEAAKSANIKRFIHVSTDEVYGERAYHECATVESLLEPTNPYAASKAAAEFIVKSYYRSFGLQTIITRGNNVYGPHQFPEKLIPKFINRLMRGQKCCIHGDGTHTRNFVFVEDVARAFDTVLHKGIPGMIYNIGTSFEISNLEVAKSLIRLFGHENTEEHIEFVEDRKINDVRYAIDSNPMEGLGWSPEVTWDEGLKRTIEWYKSHQNHWGNIEQVLTAHPIKKSRTLTLAE